MRIISRAIFREILSPTLLGLLVFTFILFVRDMGKLLEMVVSSTASPALIGKLCLLLLPNIFLFAIPMAGLLGILVGLGRLSADGEVVALRASGQSIAAFVRPVLLLAFLAAGLNLGLSLEIVPRVNRMKQSVLTQLARSQIGTEISPRVFDGRFPNLILYVQDISGDRWNGIFLVDVSKADEPKITLAQKGMLIVDRPKDRLQLYLEEGGTHLLAPQRPSEYSMIHFTHSEIPLPPIVAKGAQATRRSLSEYTNWELLNETRKPIASRSFRIELYRRFALPCSCIVLALLGIPLGISSRKGGKSYGFVLSLLVISAYYLLFVSGSRFAEDGRLSPFVGIWGTNLIFLFFAGVLIFLHERSLFRISRPAFLDARGMRRAAQLNNTESSTAQPSGKVISLLRLISPHILDEYILRGFFAYLLLSLAAFIIIFIIVTLFELISDIVRNDISPLTTIYYFVFLTPQIVYTLTPLAILVATLVNFGLLTKTNQITAMKASGLSLYRLSLSLLFSAAVISVGMFVLQDFVLPGSNQRQDMYRNIIKGRPPQTFLRPNQNWIVGTGNAHLQIYNYNYYDPDKQVFAGLSVFEIDPHSFEITRRIFARQTYRDAYSDRWIYDDGWVRDFAAGAPEPYRTFSVTTFAEMTEKPEYFVKVVKLSEQMNARELWHYIGSLQQSGFDVVRLMVQYYRKFSYPAMAFIMVLIAIPFSFSTGRRGALYGVGLSIVIGIVYWAVAGLFEAMGSFNKLNPMIAVWSPNLLFGLGGLYLLLTIDT
ncbi:MAG: LptF/LptG family permease [Acidobacteriia bacterium]|nr:LptF/LptG family permease [Terriglobia bacterium]